MLYKIIGLSPVSKYITEPQAVRNISVFSDIINGYIITMEEKGSLFTTEDVAVIFGNLREIHNFQEQFLEQLEIAFRHGKQFCVILLPVHFHYTSGHPIKVKITKISR